MTTIRPFRINISDELLKDLRRRLQATRWPDAETVDDWSQGTPLSYLKELCTYWHDSYDWRKVEAQLNSFPQFITEIDGLDIHFLHVKSPHKQALPLILTHGWPGSTVEFLKVIGPLVNPVAHGGDARDAFHVVCPSLPGYGFSGKPTKPGWKVERIAAAWVTLMARLGYSRYVAQGGDWGSFVTSLVPAADPSHCAGIHINFPIVFPDPETMSGLTEQEATAIAAFQYYMDSDSGYSKQQGTRPQSLAYGLADSPVGQAGWIVEKYHAWMDCDGHPENAVTRDELLDNIMIYWVTNSAGSSAKLYWESFRLNNLNLSPISVPAGISLFPKEIFRCSHRWAEKRFQNLVHWNELSKGGHFAAFEQPQVFVQEVRTCFRHMR